MFNQATARYAARMAAGIAMLAVLVFSSVAQAQRGGRGGGPFGGNNWLRQVMRNAEDKEVLDLLKHKPIRGEIMLTEDQYDEIRTLESSAMKEIFGARNDAQKCVEIIREFGQKAFGLLEEKQVERLEQLFVQTRKRAAAANARIAKKIGLPDEELEAFQDTVRDKIFSEKLTRKIRTIMESNIPFSQKGEKASQAFEEHFNEVNESLKEYLTAEQLEKLNDLEGEPFEDLPRMPPRGGRGRGGPGHNKDKDGGPPPGGKRDPNRGPSGDPTCESCSQAKVVTTL